jgi:glycosyltransferase involved in cell wall biosynthesis
MKIAIDARMIEHSGIGSVLRGLLPPLLELGHEQGFQFVLLGDREKLQRYLPSLAPEDVAQWRAPVFSLQEQCFPPRLPNIALWHFFHYNVPTFLRQPFVVTIHDVIPLAACNFANSAFHRLAVRYLLQRQVRDAQAIIVPSQFTGDELIWRFPNAKGKVHVIPHAVAPTFTAVSEERAEEVLTRLGIQRPYLLCVSIHKPHKNLSFLLRAFSQWSREQQNSANLVIAGLRPRDLGDLRRLTVQHNVVERVRLLAEFLSESDLAALYQGAEVLIVPSLYEGFGLPVLEAQSVGTPVLCSQAGSLPEVAGNGALYFDPSSAESLVAQLTKISINPHIRQSVIAAGLTNVRRFDWNRTASRLIEVYSQLK